MPFSCSDFGALKIGPKTGKTAGGLSSPACVPARAHSGLRGQTRRLLGIVVLDLHIEINDSLGGFKLKISDRPILDNAFKRSFFGRVLLQ